MVEPSQIERQSIFEIAKMDTNKAHPLLTLLQELESMMKRNRNIQLEDEGPSSMSNVVNTEIIPTKEPHESETRDLLSDLPDSLIHHIFFFLDFNDSVKLAAVSTRFRDLSLTSPTLYFSLNLRCHPRNQTAITCSCCTSFLSYITNLLHQRQSSFSIRHLSFFCHTHYSNSCTQHFKAHQQWIQHALTTFHVEGLLLIFAKGSYVPNPINAHPEWLFLLNSQYSLKSLILEMSNGDTLKLPEEATLLPSLQTLFLQGFYVDSSSQPIDEWICKSFPNLKRLSLRRIYGVNCLNIQSACIEGLTIENHGCLTSVTVHARNLRSFDFQFSTNDLMMKIFAPNKEKLRWETNDTNDLMMKIFAPNMEKLRWEGDVREFKWEGEMPGENFLDACFKLNHYEMNTQNGNVFVNILRGLRSARRLCIDSRILKFLLQDPSNLFGNLRHLSATIGFKRKDAKYIFSFLERSPNLDSLVIRGPRFSTENSRSSLLKFLRRYEDDKVLPVILRSSLNSDGVGLKSIGGVKKVEIIISTFYKEFILIIGMAMKIFRDLEKMTIKYPHCCEKWMTQLGVQDAIQRFDRASSSLQLFMLPIHNIPLDCPCEREI